MNNTTPPNRAPKRKLKQPEETKNQKLKPNPTQPRLPVARSTPPDPKRSAIPTQRPTRIPSRLSNASSVGRLSNASSTGRLSNASSTGRLSNASSTGRLSNASSTGRLSNASSTGRLSNASSTGRLSNASTRLSTASTQRVSNPSIGRLSSASSQRSTTPGALAKKPPQPSGSTRTPLKAAVKKPVTRPIPSWDIKGQIKSLQAKNTEVNEQTAEIEKERDQVQTQVESNEEKLKEALAALTDLEDTIKSTEEKYQEELKEIQTDIDSKTKELTDRNESQVKKIASLEAQVKQMEKEMIDTLKSIETEKTDQLTLSNQKSKLEASYVEADSILFDRRMLKNSTEKILKGVEDKLKGLRDDMIEKQKLIKDIERQLFESEIQRRKDHERLQELKGNIRVFCRVRPEINKDLPLVDMRFFGEENESMELLEKSTSALGKMITKTSTYTFDKVFSPESTQKECYEEISQLVQSALDGFNICIFAYGQTGSGKTYTMQGSNITQDETSGMIPRAVQQIYEVAQQLKDYNWEYKMEGQFLEIYNETINDLLGDTSNYGKIKHDIHHDKTGRTTVTDMTTVVLDSPSKVKIMLKKANQNRATGATQMNERSSRSHSVFTLTLTGYNKITNEKTIGILNLIDLAGSERLSMSGATGDRLTETININKSLSCLKNVIHALVNNKEGGHIPYRNSKLTYLLRNSLGGNCKTLMFVNISPLMEHLNESICSLRFATEVNSCHVGTAKKLVTK